MMNKILFMFLCAVVCYAQQAPENWSGAISGNLRGEDGTSIAGASISLQLASLPPSGRLPSFPSSAKSGADGSYSFGGLHAGPYRICAQAPGTVWLNPCDWGLQVPAAALTAAQKSVSLAVTMKKGVALPIRVDDPTQLLSNNEGKTPGAHLLIGVASDALVFHHATLVSTDSAGRNFEIVIPFGAPINLVVNGGFFLVSNVLGQPLTPTASTLIPVIVAAGHRLQQ
jgi:hypothetical protein